MRGARWTPCTWTCAGTLVAEHVDDADGEILRRVRNEVGPAVPVVASLDFHANVSLQIAQQATALVSYRAYPHVDMADCGARAARVLHDLLGGTRVTSCLEQMDFLIPLTSQSTLAEPLQSLMSQAAMAERPPVLSVCLAPGFPAADVADCGPSVYAWGTEQSAVESVVRRLAAELGRREGEFALELYGVEQAIAEVRALGQRLEAGRSSWRTRRTTLGGRQRRHNEPDQGPRRERHAARARRRDLRSGGRGRGHAGAAIELGLGAGTGTAGETPLAARFKVLALGDGRFTGTGPFYRGGRFELGPMALLEVGDVHVAVASRKQQAADQAMFRHLGVEPADYAVLALKSSVHFRADFGRSQPHPRRRAPGPNIPTRRNCPSRVRSGLRTSPRRA